MGAGWSKANLLYLNMDDTCLADVEFGELEEFHSPGYVMYPEILREVLRVCLGEPQAMKPLKPSGNRRRKASGSS